MYRADMIGIEIDGLPRSMYGDGPSVGGVTAFGGGPVDPPVNLKPATVSRRQEIKESFKNSREYTVLKKVIRLLQDNRLNSGDEETEAKLEQINRTESESYPILKTILNVLFITIGLVLLIGVIVVIIYTSFVVPESEASQPQPYPFFATVPPSTISTKPAELIALDPDPHPNQLPDYPDEPLEGGQPAEEKIQEPALNNKTENKKKGVASSEAPPIKQLLTVETIQLPNGTWVKAVNRCRMSAIVQSDTSIRLGTICYKVPISAVQDEEAGLGAELSTSSLGKPRPHAEAERGRRNGRQIT